MMETLMLRADCPADIARVGEILRGGGLVAIPTETVYGLAGNALDAAVAAKIYEVKGRPSDNPLIVHIADISDAEKLVTEIPEAARRLMDAFWPGPLTVILKKSDLVPKTTTGGLDTVALRMPSHPAARAVIRAAGVPLAAPSANLSGLPSPSRFQHIADDLTGRVEAILDGGDCAVGVESTVVTLVDGVPRVLRPGGVSVEALREVLGTVEVDPAVLAPPAADAKVASPGMKYKHYAPKCEVTILDASLSEFVAYLKDFPDAAVLCFAGEEPRFPGRLAIPYGREEDALSEAHGLFAALRLLDAYGAKRAFARRPKLRGVGLAVYNRLLRASAFRVTVPETPLVLGLTGPSGAGKSTVAACLKNAGAAVIDCDDLTKDPSLYAGETLSALQNAFGRDRIMQNGALDRRALARAAFADEDGRERLNAITHPVILRRIEDEIQARAASGARVIVLDAPTLFEAGANALCRRVAVVMAPEDVRLARVMRRDGLSEKDAVQRIAAQPPETYYTDRADFVLSGAGARPDAAELASLCAALGLSEERV